MASEPLPLPGRTPRRAPRGVADLPRPTMASSTGEAASVTGSAPGLTAFKPKRRNVVAEFAPSISPPVNPVIAALTAPHREEVARPPSPETPCHRAMATRRLIINADDFGRSPAINEAIIRAHREGVLTTASLMVNGDAFAEAVTLAKAHPQLGVGLHLTLICGKATCSQLEIPDLVTPTGDFSDSPVAAGLRYYFHQGLRLQLAREIGAQFAKFKATGLTLDHVNGHLNFHLHPTVLRILLARHTEWGIRHFRLTDDPFGLSGQLTRGRLAYRASHAFIFRNLSRRARQRLVRSGIRFTEQVFGLLQNGHVDEDYLLQLLAKLPRGDSELYSHPSLTEFRHEFEALISPRVKARLEEFRIETIRYQDL